MFGPYDTIIIITICRTIPNRSNNNNNFSIITTSAISIDRRLKVVGWRLLGRCCVKSLLPVVTVVSHVVGLVLKGDRARGRSAETVRGRLLNDGVLLVPGRPVVRLTVRLGRLVQVLLRLLVFAVRRLGVVFAVRRVHWPGRRLSVRRRPVVVAAVAERPVVVLQVGLAQFEESDEAGHDQRHEAQELLERRQAEDERQEQQQLQLEQFQHDQQRDE